MRTKRTELLLLACAIAGLAVAPVPAGAAQTAHVHVLDTVPIPSFDPPGVSILLGDRVEWDNHADRLHTVTNVTCKRADARYDDCEFDSVFSLTPGTTFGHTFDRAGVFDYKCTIHGFTGRITVLDDPGALPDLAIEQLTPFETTLRTSKRLEALVTNRGAAPALEAKILFQYRNVDGTWIDIGEPTVPALNPGATIAVNQDWLTINKVGDFPVRAVVDAGSTLLESDEDNNEHAITVAVLVPAGLIPGIALPDP